jgi:preprotein translocase subunit YajC
MLNATHLPAIVAMAAPPSGGGGQQSNLIATFAPLLVIFAIFYFLMIRPQQKQQKQHREMLAALKKGDRVVTRGGMMGTIYAIAETIVTLEIADNVRVKFSRDAIAGVEAGNA